MAQKNKKQEPNMFKYTELNNDHLKEKPVYDFVKLYEQACSELSLQQEKRDYILKSYVLLISIVVPILLSIIEKVKPSQMGFMLLAIGLIGFLYSLIIIRYRVYKEIYWITCRVISQLLNFEEDAVNKRTVQALFYECLSKKWGKFIRERKNGKKRILHLKVFSENIFSAESLLYLVMAFFTAVISGVGIYMFVDNNCYSVYIPIIAGVLIFAYLLAMYFSNLKRVFMVLADGTEASFNFSFGKAWFLHFYREKNL